MVSDLGFLITDTGVLLVEDLQDGQQERLPAGEAMLTQAGDAQLRAALGADDATYFDVALVEPGAEAAGGTGSVFASEPFPGTGARHDVDLLQDAVAAGAAATIPAGALPTLVLVLDGSADVATDAGDVVSLADGEAVSLPGALTVTAGENGASIAAAVTGPAVPRLAGGAGTPTAPARTIESPQPAATPRAQGQRVVTTAPTASPEANAAASSANAAASENADDDGDGLTNAEELALNTDPALADTDEDGLTDGDEVHQYGTEPLAPDTDGDGVLDGDEVAQGTDPLDAGAVVAEAPVEAAAPAAETGAAPEETTGTEVDSDGDGLPDSIELQLGTDPSDPDTDDDGATDGTEYYTLQTGTRNPDTDGDGVSDGDEAINGTDPNDPNSN
jgi:hypothetical protein